MIKRNIFFLLFVFLSTLSVHAQSAWQVPLHISCEGLETTLYFGVHADGTDGFDTGLDEMSPPPAFMPFAYFSIESFPNYLLTDIRKTDESVTWHLCTENCSGKTIKLKWDVDSFISENDENAGLIMSGTCNMVEEDSILVTGDLSMTIDFTMSTSVQTHHDRMDDDGRDIMAFPNPFNGTVSIIMPESGEGSTQIDIYDVSGRRVNTIVQEALPNTDQLFYWNGTDNKGNAVPTGHYICRVISGDKVFRLKIQVLR